VLVDLLATDLDLHAVDEGVADVVHPARLGVNASGVLDVDRREVTLRYMRLMRSPLREIVQVTFKAGQYR
jgi:hypothetical protein